MSGTSPVSQPPVSAERYYEIIRGQIEHEDGLISQRISWFVTAQSFLFTAYAIVTSNLHAGADRKEDQMRLLLLLIPISAMLTSLLIYATIVAGFIAISDLRNLYRTFADHSTTTALPPVQGYRRTQVLGQAAPMFLPIVFLVIWVVLLINGT